MRRFSSRRWRNGGIIVWLSVLFLLADQVASVALRQTSILTGWVLLALIVLLTLYNVRKKLPFLPLGSSASWLQMHIYVGLLTIVVFGLHVHWRIPHGMFETILTLWYLALVFSGVIGLVLSRTFARRLTTRGEEVIFERIPRIRNRIQATVEKMVLRCLAETESTAIPEYYATRLKPFFERPQHFWGHLLLSDRPRRTLLVELESQSRYLNETERWIIGEIADQVRSKDDLDYQYAHQATLKYWLFSHIPLTYGLLVFIVFHIVLVYAFSGGIR